ncbi:MAG: hypothetical protein P8047_04410, partial [Gammaproteobacteria bacterium]
MNIQKDIYGTNNPTPPRRHFFHIVYVLMILFFWGFFSDFVPTSAWSETGWHITIVLSVLFSVFIWFLFLTGKAKFKENASKNKKIFVLLFIPLITTGFTWGAVVYGVPALINRAFGSEAELV